MAEDRTQDIENPYARPPEAVIEPPQGFWQTIKYLGPGLLLVGSVVGSGEIILTTTLGAAVGFLMLWWMLISCWGKSMIQAELGRHTVSSGETVLQAFNHLPGKLPGPNGKISWFIWLWLINMIPGHLNGGGIYGGAGQAINLAFPFLESKWWTILLAVLAAVLIISGTYRFLEKLIVTMVMTFTLVTITCAIMLQYTEYAITWADFQGGLTFEFPAIAIAAALAAYGATGVTAGETMSYTYWCVEKGYARFTGVADDSPEWLHRAKGWIKVMQADVGLTLITLTCATVPFYMLGAGVLHKTGAKPNGLETLSVLSNMYTETLGAWAAWIFMIGAFFVLFSTVVGNLGAGSRAFADCMGVLGVIDPNNYKSRVRVRNIWAVVSPTVMSLSYFFIENPVWMLTIGGIASAMLAPIVAGGTIYLRYTHLDKRIAPTWKADSILWMSFIAMLILALFIVKLKFF